MVSKIVEIVSTFEGQPWREHGVAPWPAGPARGSLGRSGRAGGGVMARDGDDAVTPTVVGPARLLQDLMDDLLAFNLRWIERWISMEYDGLHFADDWGGQEGLLISPQLWRQLFKPRYAEMFRIVHDAGMDVWFHSDGKINAILPDLVEIGVNVINCQVRLVGFDWVASNLRGAVAFRTDIDRQRVLPFGAPDEVKAEVHRTFAACGSPQGGIIACGEIGPDVPLENIRAMYEAFREL
jgi:uroporphyrinogen-III decarboxylase